MPPKSITKILFFLIAALIYSACANIIQPTGGAVDKQAPRLDTLHSTSNMQTNFKKQEIILTFNEWLQLKDVFNQVIVSPPLEFQPEVRLKKKSIIFKFDDREQLKEGATYVINFGTAVQDLTEGNEVPNLRFVFATGDYIDSLSVSGQVVDALTAKPVEKVKVMLYEELADSVVRSKRPFYFAITNKEGQFKINNVKSDTFKVFALTGLDYFYNNSKEQIAFLNDPIIVSDTVQPTLQLKLFAEKQSLKLLKEDIRTFGKVNLIFNGDPSAVQLTYDGLDGNTFIEQEKDSIKIWYDTNQEITWNVFVHVDSTSSDTVIVKTPARQTFLERSKLKLANKLTAEKRSNVKPGEALTLTFNHPLVAIDTSLLAVLEDSVLTLVRPRISIDSTYKRRLNILYKWKPGMVYKLEILPAAITDIYGLQNDTLRQNIQSLSKDMFGNIKLTLEDMDSTQQYVVQLMAAGDKLIEEFVVTEKSTFQKIFNSLAPGQYQLRILEDSNRNGSWDTGSYDLKRQPERLFTKKLEELRADWEVDATVAVQPGFQ